MTDEIVLFNSENEFYKFLKDKSTGENIYIFLAEYFIDKLSAKDIKGNIIGHIESLKRGNQNIIELGRSVSIETYKKEGLEAISDIEKDISNRKDLDELLLKLVDVLKERKRHFVIESKINDFGKGFEKFSDMINSKEIAQEKRDCFINIYEYLNDGSEITSTNFISSFRSGIDLTKRELTKNKFVNVSESKKNKKVEDYFKNIFGVKSKIADVFYKYLVEYDKDRFESINISDVRGKV